MDQHAGDGFVTIGQDAQLKYWKLPVEIEGNIDEPAHSIGLEGETNIYKIIYSA